MKLLGAKEFLKTVKSGTLFCELWMDNEEDCFKIIKDFENGVNILDKYTGEFLIYGNNTGSLTFLKSKSAKEVLIDNILYNCLFYYDHNIVGDASPGLTLQLVFENEDEWPEQINVDNSDQVLNKQDIKRIRDYFLATEGPFKACDWALEALEKDYYKDNKIVNYKSSRTIKTDKEKLQKNY